MKSKLDFLRLSEGLVGFLFALVLGFETDDTSINGFSGGFDSISGGFETVEGLSGGLAAVEGLDRTFLLALDFFFAVTCTFSMVPTIED